MIGEHHHSLTSRKSTVLPCQRAATVRFESSVPQRPQTPQAGFRRRTGPIPKLLQANPPPLFANWVEPENIAAALELHMFRHGETA
jgi:hypothetical protein